MSEEKKQNDKAKILLELDENDVQLKRRRADARELANHFQYVGRWLETEPEKIVFGGESTDLTFQNTTLADASAINLDRVIEVREAIRELEKRQKFLRKQKSDYD